MLFTLAYSTPLAQDLNPGSTASAYTAGKAIGTVFTIDCQTPIRSGINGPVALIETLVLADAEKVDGDLDLFLFDDAPAAVIDGATFAPSSADLHKMIGPIRVRAADWSDLSANSVATKPALVLTARLKTPPHLFGLIVARSAITFANAGSLTGKLSGFVN